MIGQYTLKSMAPVRVTPISENQLLLKSEIPLSADKRFSGKPCSSRLAFTMSNRRAVLKNWTMKTPFEIRRVCSERVSCPIPMISLMMMVRRITLIMMMANLAI